MHGKVLAIQNISVERVYPALLWELPGLSLQGAAGAVFSQPVPEKLQIFNQIWLLQFNLWRIRIFIRAL